MRQPSLKKYIYILPFCYVSFWVKKIRISLYAVFLAFFTLLLLCIWGDFREQKTYFFCPATAFICTCSTKKPNEKLRLSLPRYRSIYWGGRENGVAHTILHDGMRTKKKDTKKTVSKKCWGIRWRCGHGIRKAGSAFQS